MTMIRPAALIMDFDGTMVDTELPAYESARRVWARFGLELPMDWWLEGMGTDRKTSWVVELRARLGRDVDVDALMEERRRIKDEVTDSNPLLDGVAALLDEADRRGVALAVASSSRHDWVDRHLDRVGVLHRFAAVVCRDDVGDVAKPAPDVYVEALRRLDLAPRECAAVEDSPNGLRAAIGAGLRTLCVPNPLVRHLDFDGAHAVVRDLTELDPASLLESLAP